MIAIGAGLCTAYQLILSVFRISTMEVDSYLTTALETSASVALTGVTHYLSTHTNSMVPSLLCTAVQLAFARHVRSKYVSGRRYRDVDLTGKVYIVTGANAGIGYETCKHLVRMGGTVVMACRSAERAAEAKQRIITEINCAPTKIIFLELDLSSLDSVRKFAQAFIDLKLPLHGLINNAGLMNSVRQLSKDGFEMMFAANHLGHFLLTNLLLLLLEQSKGRVVNLSSVLHKLAKKFDFDDIQAEKYYELFYSYGQSKLANVLFTVELQKRMDAKGSKVFCCAVHPGCVRTEVVRGMHWVMQIGNMLAAPLMVLLQKTPEEGAYCSIYAATDPDIIEDASKKGQYFFHCAVEPTGAAAKDSAAAKRLWEVSEQLAGINK